MKKILVILLCFLSFNHNCNAISAKSYIVMDMNSKQILSGININDKHLIASISKIMTCIIAIEKGDLNIIVTVDKDILKAVGSSIYIEIGEKISLEDLLYGMMMRSGNDAAIMIAKTISGSMDNFVSLMNEYAQKLEMKNTIFYNSHGLEEQNGNGNISTAYDMAILTSYAMKNEIFRRIFSTKEYTAKSDKKTYKWYSKNKLLKYDYINGGKTGYTIKAKRTLVTTAKINDINVVVVTLNDSNDWEDHLTLYDFVSKTYKKVNVVNKKDFEVIDDTIFDNDHLYIKKNIYVTLRKSEENELKIKYYLVKKDSYNNNEKVGYINVYLKDKIINSEPIYVKLKKKKNSLFH